jgi:hypothetical protein
MFKKGSFAKMPELLLHNKFVLYFIFIIAVGNIFHYTFTYDLTSVAVFIVSGLLTSFFSKNMIVILVIAMVVSNIFRYGNKGKEGYTSLDETFQDVIDSMEDMDEDDDEDMEDEDDDMDEDDDEDMEEDDDMEDEE